MMTYRNAWFHGRTAVRELPAECWQDCSAPGQSADDAVAYWLQRLEFDGPAWLMREHLASYGVWTPAELADHQQNRARLLWVWACDCRTAGRCEPLYLQR